MKTIVLSLLLLAVQACIASPHPHPARWLRNDAPHKAACAASPLIRKATGVNQDEAAYVAARKTQADKALQKWLVATSSEFASSSSSSSSLPTIAMSSSGGGFRAMLIGAGVHQALDERETSVNSTLKGLYQAMTYESALSGGGWLLSSIMGNNWKTVSSLRDSLWYRTLPATPLLPDQLGVLVADIEIVEYLIAKKAAGYDPTIVDVYGRLLSYVLLEQPDGGVKQTMASIQQMSNYVNRQYPFPILTALQSPAPEKCLLPENSTQWEFSPIEFGSWDAERAAFMPTSNAGSIVGNDGSLGCINSYDNLGYVLGTSSDIFTEFCTPSSSSESSPATYFYNYSEKLLSQVNHRPAVRDLYAPYPNSFDRQSKPAKFYAPTGRTPFSEIYLTDGGLANQINPVWPFLHRNVDVLFVEDSNAESSTNGYPDNGDLHTTYLVAQQRGLPRMPYVPDNVTSVARGYNRRPTFFGCDEPNAMTIIYLPNNEYVYQANTSTFKISYTKPEIDGMLANGQAVATNNGTSGFATCVGCAVMKKTSTTLPSSCDACFKQYCATK